MALAFIFSLLFACLFIMQGGAFIQDFGAGWGETVAIRTGPAHKGCVQFPLLTVFDGRLL